VPPRQGGQHLGVFTQLFRDLQRWAAATLAAYAGDHRERCIRTPRSGADRAVAMTAVERITAAARAGETALAQRDLDALATFAAASRLPWALAATEHARAVLAPTGTACEHFERALAHHEGSGRPFDRAGRSSRSASCCGARSDAPDARAHLRAALVTFEELSPSRSQRGRARSCGPPARPPASATRPRCRAHPDGGAGGPARRARTVEQGRRHPAVDLTPTVAFHLRGVFAKHGITSRGELSQLRLLTQ
jgi:hypothetical protein